VPTADIKKRMAVPHFVGPGPQNPMGARAMYLYEGNKDTLYRIHGTNQPEYIGEAISSGCIRMTNEDVIDLYKRVKQGTVVVVLAPHQGEPRVADVRRWFKNRLRHNAFFHYRPYLSIAAFSRILHKLSHRGNHNGTADQGLSGRQPQGKGQIAGAA